MKKVPCVFVVSDKVNKIFEVIAGAAALSDKTYVITQGNETDAQTAISYGAAEVFLLETRQDFPFEEYAAGIAKVIKDNGASGLVMLPTGKSCKCLAAKLAARLDTALINDLDGFQEKGELLVRHMIYGGIAFCLEKFTSPLGILTVGGGVFAPSSPDFSKTGVISSVPFIPPANPIKRLEVKPRQNAVVDLGKARRVVSIGRGLRAREDLELVKSFAAAIGAETGCSRPVAESEHWMERERYIGVSGVMLKNDVFVAVGISGQIQHMVGAMACKTIIAVNKDKSAPVFKFADYGIVGDLYKILPKLTKAFQAGE